MYELISVSLEKQIDSFTKRIVMAWQKKRKKKTFPQQEKGQQHIRSCDVFSKKADND